jgi:hypothetical protein
MKNNGGVCRNWQETRGSNGMLPSEKRVAGEAAVGVKGDADD